MTKNTARQSVFLIGALVATLLAGCQASGTATQSPGASQSGGDKGVVYYLSPVLSDEYQVGSQQFMQSYGEQLGYTIRALTANNNATTQLGQIDDAIGQKPLAIILNAVDADVEAATVGKARDAGLLVEAYDRLIPNAKVDFSSSADMTKLGELAGERSVAYLKGKFGSEKGVVLEVMGDPGDYNAVYLDQGFTNVLGKYPDIEVIRKEAQGWEPTNAASIIDDQLTARGDEINVMFAANDPWVPAYTSVLQSHGYSQNDPRLYIIGQGGTPTGLEGIRSGWLQETVDYPMGPEYKSMFEFLDKLAAGQPIPTGDYEIDGFQNTITMEDWGPTLHVPGEVISKAGGDGTLNVDDPTLWGNVKMSG